MSTHTQLLRTRFAAIAKLQNQTAKTLTSDPADLCAVASSLPVSLDTINELLKHRTEIPGDGRSINACEYEALLDFFRTDEPGFSSQLKGKPNLISVSDQGRLIVLEASGRDLSTFSLPALTRFPHLEALMIGSRVSTPVCDLSPIGALSRHRALTLVGFSCETLDWTSNLRTLTNLSIRCAAFESAAPFGALKNLETLSFHDVALADYQTLKMLPPLNELTMRRCGLTDVSMLADLQVRGYLNLKTNEITDVRPLERLMSSVSRTNL